MMVLVVTIVVVACYDGGSSYLGEGCSGMTGLVNFTPVNNIVVTFFF